MIVDSQVFFKKNISRTLWGVYHYFGVKRKSYIGSIVRRIYEYYCSGAKNLYIEYLIYYRKEFGNYREFLVKKYNLFESEVDQIKSKLLYCKNLNDTPDTNIRDFKEYDRMNNIIQSFLGGSKNED